MPDRSCLHGGLQVSEWEAPPEQMHSPKSILESEPSSPSHTTTTVLGKCIWLQGESPQASDKDSQQLVIN